MKPMERRIDRIESKLNVSDKPPKVVDIVFFGDGDLPPEHTAGGITCRYVRHKDMRLQKETEGNKI